MDENNNNNNKLLNKKHKHSKNNNDDNNNINKDLKKNNNSNKKFNFNKKFNNKKKRKLEPIEQLYQKAKNLYEKYSESYDLDKIDYSLKENKSKKWTYDLIKTGTFEDKISSLILYIKENPKFTLKYIEILLKMLNDNSNNRRKKENIILVLKDLFLNNLLNGIKHLPFNIKYQNNKNLEFKNISNDELIESFYEDKIHHLYLRLILIIENNILNEPLIQIKKKNLNYLFEMLLNQPECEEKILSDIINKLGDPNSEISNFVINLLKNLQEQHLKMSFVIFNNVKTFFTQSQNVNAKLNSLIYLTQMKIPFNNNKFIEESIKFFFELFNQFSKKEDEEEIENKKYENKKILNKKEKKNKIMNRLKKESESNEKFLTLIVKRINILFNFIKNNKNQMNKINNLVQEKINILFKLSHNKNIKLSIEILKLLFAIIQTQDLNYNDRYYRTLYEFINNFNLSTSKYLKDALKLILLSLIYDTNTVRISSFLKRLLQMCLCSEPNYIICVLIIISQVLRNKNKLWKMIEKKEIFLNNKDNNNYYDFNKRDPKYSNSENCYLNEIYLLCNHYHPSVQRIAKFILENYNKEIVNYEGNPLLDFSLVNFLEKFVLKNPKIKKIKKNEQKDNINNENNLIENKLKNFINDENDNNNPNYINNNDIELGDDDFAFINKFNQVYPKITNSKNYLKKLKRKEKKNKEKNEDDLIDDLEDKNNIDEELEKYADKVMEDEYKKIDKNANNDEEDEDNLEEELGSFEEEEEDDNNNNEEDLNENYDDEEEDENNVLFADANDYKNQIEKNMEIAEEGQNDDEDFMNKKPKKKFKRK